MRLKISGRISAAAQRPPPERPILGDHQAGCPCDTVWPSLHQSPHQIVTLERVALQQI